jgi:basic membrane lipoprotein Med (substrate-binding protein (PBP1-ABC) superfamily)
MRAALTALAVLCVSTAAGCGSAQPKTTTVVTKRAAKTVPSGLRVAVVGKLGAKALPGASIEQKPDLASTDGYPLVVVSAQAADLSAVSALALGNPTSHYAYVGTSTKGYRHANLVGIVLNDAQAAQLGGAVAGLVAEEQGGLDARVAWVGPSEPVLAGAFTRGAQGVHPGVTVLRPTSGHLPAACKEAALGAIARGAVVVMAHEGLCADAAIAGAHQQNHVGLRISDFELPWVPTSTLIGDAVAGIFRGGEDIVFGASSGAIGVQRLDPRIPADVAVRARAAAQQLASGLPPTG